MKKRAFVVICLGALAVVANWAAHWVEVGTAKPTPLTVHICDQGSNKPLPDILIYYNLSVATEPHVLGIPTMQTPSVVYHTLRAYSDSTGCATFDVGEIPLHVWEYIGPESVLVNLDTVRMKVMSDILGPNTNYEPHSGYQGVKVLIPWTMRDRNRKEQRGDGWELQMPNADEADAWVLTVALREHEDSSQR